MNDNNIFSPDFKTEKPEIRIDGAEITDYAAIITLDDITDEALEKGKAFADEIEARFVGDFEKTGIDKMAHVSTFMVIDGTIYMTYYANTQTTAEDPKDQTARLVYCDENDPGNKTILDIQTVGDDCYGQRVNLVYDTIMAQADENTLYILWTAKVGGTYYRLYRPFDLRTKTLGAVGVNRLKVGEVTNDFSSSGIVSALSENGIGIKKMYSDIGIMQKFTYRIENGVKYYYTGAYSGDMNMVIKSRDFITWEYVTQPSFINLSKWENAVYVIGNKLYYFVRQQDSTQYGFLSVYHIDTDTWEKPVLICDSQSRSDFIMYDGGLYMVHAPINREHIGLVHIDTDNIANSNVVLRAHMHSSCFYPFIQYFDESTLAMSYTVARQHIRLAKFDMGKYIV